MHMIASVAENHKIHLPSKIAKPLVFGEKLLCNDPLEAGSIAHVSLECLLIIQ